MCGSDGITYSSFCSLKREECLWSKEIGFACNGECPCGELLKLLYLYFLFVLWILGWSISVFIAGVKVTIVLSNTFVFHCNEVVTKNSLQGFWPCPPPPPLTFLRSTFYTQGTTSVWLLASSISTNWSSHLKIHCNDPGLIRTWNASYKIYVLNFKLSSKRGMQKKFVPRCPSFP